MADGKIGKVLAVDFHALLVGEVDERAVRKSEWAERRIQTDDPKGAEIALLSAAMDVSIRSRLGKGVLYAGKNVSIHQTISLRESDEFLMALMGGKTTFYASHSTLKLDR